MLLKHETTHIIKEVLLLDAEVDEGIFADDGVSSEIIMLHEVIVWVHQLRMLPFHPCVHRFEMNIHVEINVLFNCPVLYFQILDVLLDLGFLSAYDFSIVASDDYGVNEHLF